MKLSVVLSLSLIFIVSLNAGVVTLNSACGHSLSQRYVLFNLSNTGNDTAYALHILPFISGVTLSNGSYYLGSLGPGTKASINLTLENITAVGSYSDYIAVAYGQGSSSFVAVFPCLLSFSRSAPSQVELAYNISHSNGEDIVSAKVLNAGRDAISTNVSLILPPEFSYLSNKSFNIHLGPLQSGLARFVLSSQAQAPYSYSGAISASYEKNGTHYASIAGIVVGSASIIHSSRPSAILFGVMLLAALIVLLLARATVISRRRRHRKNAEGTE